MAAKVTLSRSDLAEGPFEVVHSGSGIMSPANQVNPMQSDNVGHFGWDVIAGYYRVPAEKSGCTAPGGKQPYNETTVLTIPPPVTNLRITLFCGEVAKRVYLPVIRR